MQKEKIAVIAIVVIIVGALSVYLTATYYPDILKNLFEEKPKIEIGDCADVHYIGRYASNDTVFGSSYSDIENKTGGTPLNIFVSLNKSVFPTDEEYMYYSPMPFGMIEGFISDLVGMKEGEEKSINIPPEKAYGDYSKLKIGDTFYTKAVALGLNQTMMVTNLTSSIISLKWINVENVGTFFTMPTGVLMEDLAAAVYSLYDSPPPYYLWENASEIINTTDETVVIKTTPTKTENITEELAIIAVGNKSGFVFPDATTVEWNETTITLISSPTEGSSYTLSVVEYDLTLILTVENITDDNINMSYEFEGLSYPLPINRTITFNRTYSIRRIYNDIPLDIGVYILDQDLESQGYSLIELAGESLIFDVEIVKLYKTSQEES